MSIFDLEHIFIVFHPGAGGNFIASLLEKIIRKDNTGIDIGTAGTAHTLIDRKIAGIDYLSFGTEVYEQSNFANAEDRINFYLDKIKSEYSNVSSPQIIWSHDFTNIPVYQKYFPNSKIIAITQETHAEKLAVVLFNVTKNILDANTVNPLTEERMTQVMKLWNHVMKKALINLVGVDEVDTLDPNSPIVKHVAFSKMLSYYGLTEDPKKSSSIDLINTVLYPANDINKFPYTIGNKYSSYTSNCVKLPYSYLLNNDVNCLIDTLSQVIVIDDEIHQIILKNFREYRNAQDQSVLKDPVSHYLNMRDESTRELKKLNT